MKAINPLSIQHLAVRCLIFIALGVLFVPGYGFAQEQEREQLTLLLDQLKNVEALAIKSRAIASIKHDTRYRFDYSQLLNDLDAIRTGINAYLTPTRAQPRRVMDFTGHYTQEDSHGR